MKKSYLFILCILISHISRAQLCSGGGSTFSGAVFFNPTWISTCTGSTSCAGSPTTFDNRASCEAVTAMDGCATVPTCGTAANNGSDIWFKFYATATTVKISLSPGVSFVAAIQAFSGSACPGLTEKGCAISAGPSSGVSLTMTGLTIGTLYYFRIYGSANTPSQRTGTFCFCGSTGMSNTILPLKLVSLGGAIENKKVIIRWATTNEINLGHFEIEKSRTGTNFSIAGNRTANNSGAIRNDYIFEDDFIAESYYYRLKMIDTDGKFSYSDIIKISSKKSATFTATWSSNNIRIFADADCTSDVFSITGVKIASVKIRQGMNNIYFDQPSNMYIIRRNDTGESQKIFVIK
jgi:hypothetical protein